MSMIDKNALMSELTAWSLEQYPKRGDKIQFYKHRGIAETMQKVWSFPTADVVEVVRCKDCKWFNDFGCAIRIVDDSDKPKDNDFCSFGERKETEDVGKSDTDDNR